jgi:hypothetical protein
VTRRSETIRESTGQRQDEPVADEALLGGQAAPGEDVDGTLRIRNALADLRDAYSQAPDEATAQAHLERLRSVCASAPRRAATA